MKQVGNTILAKGVNHILAKRDNSAWPKGAKLSGFSNKYINETTIITSCKFCHRIFKITYDEKKVPNNINDFNWGAFSLWHLWGFWNGMPILSCFGILLGLITNTFYLLFIIDIAISLYLGLQGNKLSWQKKDWSSATNFEIYQKRWNIAGIIILCLFAISGFFYGILLNK